MRHCRWRFVTGSFQHEGGGAFHSNSDIFRLDKSLRRGNAGYFDPGLRWLDQSKIGRVLTGRCRGVEWRPAGHRHADPEHQSCQCRARTAQGDRRSAARGPLPVAVHEQFMTDTAQLADVVLPATMFLEHDDIYRGGGHQHIILGPKLVEPPEGPKRQNHDVIEALGKRLGVSRPRRLRHDPARPASIDMLLQKRGLGDFESFKAEKWADVQAGFDDRAFPQRLCGHRDGKFRFKPDWTRNAGGQQAAQAHGAAGAGGSTARIPRSCRTDRERGRRTSLPAGDIAVTLFPELELLPKRKSSRTKGEAPGPDASSRGCSGPMASPNGDRVALGNSPR
jgi:hypothetical protein